MSDDTGHDRLKAVLEKLRQKEVATAEGRVLRGANADALLAAIVNEIDETILPRRLSFKADTGVTFHLAVANRRLQAMLAPAPESANPLENVALKDAEDENTSKLRDVLATTLDGATTLSVLSARQGSAGFPSDIGVPSNILARAWNIDTAESVETDPSKLMESFLFALGDIVIGWIQIEGEDVTAEQGDNAFIEELSEQAALFLDGYFAKRDALLAQGSRGRAIGLGPVGPDGTAVLFVDFDDTSAFIALPADKLGAIAAKWQNATLTHA